MRLVNPDAIGNSRTRTLTERIKQLGVGSSELLDAVFVMLLGMVALSGFLTTFDTLHFLLVSVLGLLLGILSAHAVVALRWHLAWLPLLLVGWYFLVAPGVADHDDAIAGFLPSLPALAAVANAMIGGWKQLVTTLPPVPGDGIFLALILAMALLAGGIGYAVARRSRRAGAALIMPVVLLLAATVLGTQQTYLPMLQGLVLAALGFGWLAIRHRRRRPLGGTGRSASAGLWTGAGLLSAALVLGGLFGGLLPGGDVPRWVVREYVRPPIEVKNLSSPLVGFRLYSSQNLNQLWDANLVTVTGAQPKSLLRFAVLDDYTGHTWSASGGGSTGSGFQRIGARLPEVASGAPTSLTLTFAPAYQNTRELGPWLPSLGDDAAISFAGANVKTHAATLRYNLQTGQALLTEGDRVRDGDVVAVASVPTPVGLDAAAVPGGQPVVDPSTYTFLSTIGQKWSDGATTPAEQVLAEAKHLKAGYWSDGTGNGQADYLPGHSEGRLTNFVVGDQLVGSDEQYAATFALLCNQAGFPARVVFGAILPADGVVKGKDVTAWVEVQTDQGWRAISPDTFIPDRNRTPEQVPQTRAQDKNATNVPPPNMSRSDNNPMDSAENDLNGTKVTTPWWAGLLRTLLAILRVIGPPLITIVTVLVVIALLKVGRRWRRRSSGSAGKQIVGAWNDVFDQCRDLGVVVSKRGTRLEQAAIIGRPTVTEFAVATNTATFGMDDPTPDQVAALWVSAGATRKQLLRSVGGWRRLMARFNVRSLMPERLASAKRPKLDLQRPVWLDQAGRRGVPAPGTQQPQTPQ